MAGEIDVYQLCPCGSGKKLKFCCHAIVAEMLKVADLQQSHQHQAALTLLESVEKKIQPRDVWSRAWVKTTQAFLLFSLGHVEQPRELVADVLEELPEHPLAVAVNAVLALAAEGYPGAMRAIYRAFRIAAEGQPFLISHLATALARLLMAQGHFFATREYLKLAVKLDAENEEAIETILAFARDVRLPYPARDGYFLAPLTGSDHLRPQFDQALELANKGCFSDAAKAFGAAARLDPKNQVVWWNIALCHAWAGEDPLAVEAFKAAAANQPEFEEAVDCLYLARQLRAPGENSKVAQLTAQYRVDSVSKLLTALDQRPEYSRVELPEPDDDEPRPSAVYRVLDRDPNLVPRASLSGANVAHILGELVVYDRADDDEPARAYISGYGHELMDRLVSGFAEAAGPLAAADGKPEEHGFLRAEHFPLIQDWHYPADLPPEQLSELRRASGRRIIDEIWPSVPQESLGGKTPLEAAQTPELKAALAAAVIELDAFCEKNGLSLDERAVRSRLGLPDISATPLSQREIDAFPTLLRLRHTALDQVPDETLMRAAENLMQVGHTGLSCAVIGELLSRPALQEKIDVPRLCMYLSRVCARRLDFEAAVEWVVRGKQECKKRKLPLDALALWEVHELMLRSHNPDDPEIAQLANTLWNYYLPKLPEIREVVSGVLNELSLPGPWNATSGAAAAAEPLAGAGVGSAGLWTPEAQAAGEPSKLWLPGQE